MQGSEYVNRVLCRLAGLRLTHGDIGQLVSGAVGVDTVEVGAVAVHSTQHQSRADVALVPKQPQIQRKFI